MMNKTVFVDGDSFELLAYAFKSLPSTPLTFNMKYNMTKHVHSHFITLKKRQNIFLCMQNNNETRTKVTPEAVSGLAYAKTVQRISSRHQDWDHGKHGGKAGTLFIRFRIYWRKKRSTMKKKWSTDSKCSDTANLYSLQSIQRRRLPNGWILRKRHGTV